MDKSSTEAGISTLSVFRIVLTSSSNQLFANNVQQITVHVHIRKQVRYGDRLPVNEPLSAAERASLELIRVDGGSREHWSSQHARFNPQVRLAEDMPINSFHSQPTEKNLDMAPDLMPEKINNHQEFEIIPVLLRCSQAGGGRASFIARVRLDNPAPNVLQETPISGAVVIHPLMPRIIPARNLLRQTRMMFDESVFWDKIYHWSLYITYVGFPSGSPRMLGQPEISDGRSLPGRPNLRNIFQGGRRIADVIRTANLNAIRTFEIRNGFTARPDYNDQWVTLLASQDWPIRVLQYYENPNNHSTLHTWATFRFLDEDGNTHLYGVRMLGDRDLDIVNS